MRIIVVGCGRVGQTLTEKLNADGNDVTVIDLSADKVRKITERCDVMGVVGNGATHTIQQEAGIAEADLFIAVTNSDELNLLCCLIAKKEGNCQTIARVKNPVYRKEATYLKDGVGLAMVINPEFEAAEDIARLLRFPAAIKIEPFVKGKVELIKFRLPKDNCIIGMSIKDVAIKYRSDVLVCVIERGDESYIPNGDFVFEEKDVVSIVASTSNAKDFFSKINLKGHSIKSAIVVGGGAITQYLCEILEPSGISLKIIEKDYKICEELSSKWQKSTIIHGNALDKELLLEEGIEKSGAFVALSSEDEENILLSLYAKEAGCKKLITKIKRIDYDSVLEHLDLDTLVFPKHITADSIIRYVRATKNAKGSNMETLYNIIPNEVEAAEFIIKEDSPIANIPLSALKFKKDVLIASITREDKAIVPRGNDVIKAGDSVVIVSKQLGLHDVVDVLR